MNEIIYSFLQLFKDLRVDFENVIFIKFEQNCSQLLKYNLDEGAYLWIITFSPQLFQTVPIPCTTSIPAILSFFPQ